MAEILQNISVVSFSLSAIFFVVSIFVWFKFSILNVIGDLSGRNARKSIEQIRENNEKTGKKMFRPSTVNLSRGKVTEAMSLTEKLHPNNENNENQQNMETVILDENQVQDIGVEETSLLDEGTVVLDDENATTVLSDENNSIEKLTMLDEVVFIHTEEKI